MATLTLYLGNDNVLTLYGLKDAVAGLYLNSATVTYELKDSEGATVDSGAMAYSQSSDGIYRATLSDTLALTAGAEYTVVVDADAGAGLKYHSESAVIAAVRT